MIIDKRLSNSMMPVGRADGEREPAKKKEAPTHLWTAFCMSERCALDYLQRTGKNCTIIAGAAKEGIKYRETFCPDCGFALCWKRVPVGDPSTGAK